uniref:Uncharacterized protein n=1 Tax=Ditylenchus dipsaci TaxID=166011 RepID=A0A915E289_9BILA
MNMVLPQRSLVQLDRFNSSSTNVLCTPSGTTSACSPSTSSMSTPSTVKRTLGSFSTNGRYLLSSHKSSRHLLKRSQTGHRNYLPPYPNRSSRLAQFNSSSSNTSISSKTSRAPCDPCPMKKTVFEVHRDAQPGVRSAPHLLNARTVLVWNRPGSEVIPFLPLKEAQSEVPMDSRVLHCGTVEADIMVLGYVTPYCLSSEPNRVQQLGKSKRRQSCICGEHTRHQLKEICVKISPASSVAEIFDKFMLVNQFIAEARTKGAQVVILLTKHAKNEKAKLANLDPAYCMHYHKISLNYAICHIERAAKLKLGPQIQNALELWENRLKSEQQQLLARTMSNMESNGDVKKILTTILRIIEHRYSNDSVPRKIAWS